jgi:hypothetical protein
MASILHTMQDDMASPPMKNQAINGSPALQLRKQLSSPAELCSRRLSDGDSLLSSANTPTTKSMGDSCQSSPHVDQGSDVNPEPKDEQTPTSQRSVESSPPVLQKSSSGGFFSFGRKGDSSPAKPKKMNGYVSACASYIHAH